uniref:DNA-directed primase/polymerase protein n=1 Tax=Scleropages formosus TaxID=113540 RepID=A0A8C9S8I1_SCLFO
MVLRLIQFVCWKLDDTYGVKCSCEHVLNLDSSTNEKFSRHLIFHVPNAVFKDNLHAGRFVHKILQPALDSLRRSRLVGTLSRHEAVRDALGSEPPSPVENLQPAASPQAEKRRHGEEDLSFLLVKDKDGQDQLFVDLGVYTKNRNFRLYKSSKAGKNVAFSLAEDNAFVPPPDKQRCTEERVFLTSLVTNIRCASLLSFDSVAGHQLSPYKEKLLVYDILKYRWCGNVGRFHRSNNIMIVVDLKQEVWYQKCHDPMCKSQKYRSPSKVLDLMKPTGPHRPQKAETRSRGHQNRHPPFPDCA